MDSLKFSVLDIFGYVFPGLVAMMALAIILDNTVIHLSDLWHSVISIEFETLLVMFVLGYIAGFIIDHFGIIIFNFYNSVISRLRNEKAPRERWSLKNITSKEGRVLARELSPQNFYWLQQWKVFKTLSQNFAASIILLVIASVTKISLNLDSGGTYIYDWILFIAVLIILEMVFLSRARMFDIWHYDELEIAVKILNLKEKAKGDDKR